MKIAIGPYEFKTKKMAIEFIRNVLVNELLCGGSCPPDSLAHEVLSHVLESHPYRAEKVGPGFDRFFVRPNPIGSGTQVLVFRTDGTSVDMSWQKYIGGVNQNKDEHDVLNAMRRAVIDDIIRFRNSFSGPCSICGMAITPDDRHVDHESPTFAELAASYRGGTTNAPAMECDDKYGGMRFKNRDDEWVRGWVSFGIYILDSSRG